MALALGCAGGSANASPADPTRHLNHAADHIGSIAFHYGKARLDELRVFDAVVVDPDSDYSPIEWADDNQGRSQLYAYVSIGEMRAERSYASQAPAGMLRGTQPVWGGRIIDQAHADWPKFFVERIINPLWERGYRGFFLDTVDAHRAGNPGSEELQRQEDGLVAAIDALKREHPQAGLILNRGFELLARVQQHVQAVAAESLYGRWDERMSRYGEVSQADRQWLLDRFADVRRRGLVPIAIDYANPSDRAASRRIAQRILADDVLPWVGDGHLETVGVGRFEVQPRRVIVLHDSAEADGDEHQSNAQRLLAMPLQYLGYRVELRDITRQPAPESIYADRFAAVVGIFERSDSASRNGYADYLARAHRAGIPLVFFNSLGLAPGERLLDELGIALAGHAPRATLRIRTETRPVTGFEAPVVVNASQTQEIRAPADADVLLGFEDETGERFDAIATTPWGGFALSPYVYLDSIESSGASPWVVDPIAFLSRALGAGTRFAPDPTTENGRRLLLTHVDGDGFASRAEIPGSPFAAEVMLHEFIEKYRIPHTISVIVGEISRDGTYPKSSEAVSRIAQQIYRQPNVEPASHTFSHPFYWRRLVASGGESHEHLPIPGYRFSLDAEIAGSVRYIDEHLLASGRKTRILLWSGDCQPPPSAIAATEAAGLLNMNGGDTLISRANPSLSLVAAMSLRKQGHLQVFAPNQNENVYTNDWTGPFYGYERVIETFELTETPRRIKPINIYYHTYSASKQASIRALEKVYRWALTQAVNPVYASEYIEKIRDFDKIQFALDLSSGAHGTLHWRIAGDGALRTLRIGDSLYRRIDWQASPTLLGAAPAATPQSEPGQQYLHLGAARNELVLRTDDQIQADVRVVSANGRIDALPGKTATRMRFSAHVPGEIDIAHPRSCRVSANGRRLTALAGAAAGRGKATGPDMHRYQLGTHDDASPVLVSVDC